MRKQKILFVCTGNSARSQMAEGFVNNLYKDKYEAYSAGTEPSKVNPLAIKVMNETGIDISNHRSKGTIEMLDKEFDLIVTVCDTAKQTCPVFPKMIKQIHKGFEDPAAVKGSEEQKLVIFRNVRDEIREWLKGFLV